jgi:hypothetical protein
MQDSSEAESTPPANTLLAFAERAREWFPELLGNVVAVTEVTVDKRTSLALPYGAVALIKETYGGQGRSNNVTISESFVFEIYLKPEKYVDGQTHKPTPFYAFYDYSVIRNRLLSKLISWVAPAGCKIKLLSLDTTAEEWATVLTFTCVADYDWCDQSADEDGDGATVKDRVNCIAVALVARQRCDEKSLVECSTKPEESCEVQSA